jgi:peroxiredoxin
MRLVRSGLIVVLVLVVTALGVFSGRLVRKFALSSESSVVTMPAPTSLLKKGEPFPDVVVQLSGDFASYTSTLLSPRGGVVLFLDLECPPCTDMAAKWQAILDEEEVEDLNVLGIANHPLHIIEGYTAEHGIRFPVVADTSHTFLREYKVDRFPLEVIVSRRGTIVSTSYDSGRAIDFGKLGKMLGD